MAYQTQDTPDSGAVTGPAGPVTARAGVSRRLPASATATGSALSIIRCRRAVPSRRERALVPASTPALSKAMSAYTRPPWIWKIRRGSGPSGSPVDHQLDQAIAREPDY